MNAEPVVVADPEDGTEQKINRPHDQTFGGKYRGREETGAGSMKAGEKRTAGRRSNGAARIRRWRPFIQETFHTGQIGRRRVLIGGTVRIGTPRGTAHVAGAPDCLMSRHKYVDIHDNAVYQNTIIP